MPTPASVNRAAGGVAVGEAKAFQQAVIDASPDLLFVYDVVARATVWRNRSISSLLGYGTHPDEDMTGDLADDLVVEEDRADFNAALAGAHDHAGDDAIHVDYRMMHHDGTERWFSRRTAVLSRQASGQVRQVVGIIRETTDQKRAEAALRESESLFHQLADSIDVAFLLRSVDPPAFLYVSPVYAQLFGYDPMVTRQTVAQALDQIHPEDRERFFAEYWEPCQAGLAAVCEYRIIDSAGELRWIRAKTAPVVVLQGGFKRAASTVEDITVRRKAELQAEASQESERTAILEARDAAMAASQRQRDFAASASHELRTPTASILGFIEEVLDSETLSQDDRECLEVAHRNAKRMSALIDDLLIVGEPVEGGSQLKLTRAPLVGVVDLVVASLAATATRANVAVTRQLDEVTHGAGEQLCAVVDPLRLEQALTNLVSNAVKFSRAGGRVTVTLDSDDALVHIRVTDTGIGIATDALDSIFDRFYRTQAAVDVGIKGTGLGLPIARQMVEAQGGQLTVTSVADQGSTFTVTFPLAARAETA